MRTWSAPLIHPFTTPKYIKDKNKFKISYRSNNATEDCPRPRHAIAARVTVRLKALLFVLHMGLDVAMEHMPRSTVLDRACLLLNVYYWRDPNIVCHYENSRGSENRLLSLMLNE